jgi:hypothetical protein
LTAARRTPASGLRKQELHLHVRVGLAGKRALDQRQRLGVGARGEIAGGLEPHRAFRREKAQAGDRPRDLAADAVVDRDALAWLGDGLDLGAGGSVDRTLAGDDQHALAGLCAHAVTDGNQGGGQ